MFWDEESVTEFPNRSEVNSYRRQVFCSIIIGASNVPSSDSFVDVDRPWNPTNMLGSRLKQSAIHQHWSLGAKLWGAHVLVLGL